MQFVNDGFRPRAADIENGVPESSGVDNLAGLSDIVRLKARCRIGHNQIAIDPKLVAGADMRGRTECLIPAVRILGHAPRHLTGFKQFDGLGGGRPEVEDDAVRGMNGPCRRDLIRNAETLDQRFLVFFLRPFSSFAGGAHIIDQTRISPSGFFGRSFGGRLSCGRQFF